MATIFDRT